MQLPRQKLLPITYPGTEISTDHQLSCFELIVSLPTPRNDGPVFLAVKEGSLGWFYSKKAVVAFRSARQK